MDAPNKYYVKITKNKLVDRFIHIFKRDPGLPFYEIQIPNCCTVTEKSFIVESGFVGDPCAGGANLSINESLVPINDGVTPILSFSTFEDYVAYLNTAYAGKFIFEIVSSLILKITILIDFTIFQFTDSFACE